MTDCIDAAFTKSLPKVEIHAHLTGSITSQTLHSIWQHHKVTNADLDLVDSLETLSTEKSWDIHTFFPLFSSYTYALISTPETVTWSTHSVLHDFYADGVVYLELRTTPRCASSFSKGEYVKSVLDCMEKFENKNTMSTYLILSIDRRNTADEAIQTVDLALKFRDRGVVGIDLCGDPKKGDIRIFETAFRRAKREGLGITLHFAETWESSSQMELETLLGFEPDRLGHVVHVDEGLSKEIANNAIGLELCVSCNVKAGLTQGGVGAHHFGRWWTRRKSMQRARIALCVSCLTLPIGLWMANLLLMS